MPEITIPAPFVKIEDFDQIPTEENPIEGSFLLRGADNKLVVSSVANFKKEIQTGIKGEATPASSPTPYVSGDYPEGLFEKWDIKTAGTYTNFLDGSTPTPQPIVVTTSDLSLNFVQIWVKNGVSSKMLSEKPQAALNIPRFEDVVFPVGEGKQVSYQDAFWQVNDGMFASSTDIPSESSTVWKSMVKQTITNLNFNPDQIVPTEALYNDASQTIAVDMLKRIDLTTGLDANYRETTVFYDGTTINDTKIASDGIIFKKIGTKYYILVDFAAGIPVNVKYFGVKGDGVTDDTQKNQKAIDLSIKYGFVLYYPKGVYLVSWTNKQSGYWAPVDLSSSTENYKSVQIIGDGPDKSKILLAAGQADYKGRYTECVRYYANKAGKITSRISIRGISIDMNARSNSFPEASGVPFQYEQSHALVFNGHATNEERVDFIDIDDVEILDKIGGGIVFATAPKMSIGRVKVNNFVSLKHTQFPNSIYGPIIKLGMRGDLELGAKADASFVTGCKMQYTQIEPVIASSAEFKRNTNISDVIVDKFEFTDSGGFSLVNASKLTARSFLVRGIQGTFIGSNLTFDGGVSNGNLRFSDCTILVKYDSATNSIYPAQCGIVAGATENYTIDFDTCTFTIDSSDANITPTGFMFRGNGSTTAADAERFRYSLSNCKFDKRSEKNIEAYAHGIWKISDCEFACRGNAIYTGSFTGYYSSVEVVNCNFKNVVGRPINIQASVLTFNLKVVGTYDMYGKHFFERTAGTAFIPNTTIPNSATFISDAPILNGFMPYNQLILKKDSTGGLIGWRQSSVTNVQNWREINEFTKAPTQAASTATDVATMVTDFNALLTKLKNAGIVS